MVLRSLAECHITLAYLINKDKPDLWLSFRRYGTGKAHLAFAKFRSSKEKPQYIGKESLFDLANGEKKMMFNDIDLGNWANSNLRDQSMKAGVRDIYDQYYEWPSSYAHGQWGAIQESIFQYCGNSLHRHHLIPRKQTRTLEDVTADACFLVDKTLTLIDKLFPHFSERVTLSELGENSLPIK